jgi:hypothetical protein
MNGTRHALRKTVPVPSPIDRISCLALKGHAGSCHRPLDMPLCKNDQRMQLGQFGMSDVKQSTVRGLRLVQRECGLTSNIKLTLLSKTTLSCSIHINIRSSTGIVLGPRPQCWPESTNQKNQVGVKETETLPTSVLHNQSNKMSRTTARPNPILVPVRMARNPHNHALVVSDRMIRRFSFIGTYVHSLVRYSGS